MPQRGLTRRQVLRRRRIVVLAGLLLALLGTSMLLVRAGQAAWSAVSGAITTSTDDPVASTAADAPAWIDIPDAGVDRHPIVGRGVSDDGSIDPDQGQIIWYTGSGTVMPGELGTAVVAGHVEYYSQPDAFARLHQLRPGDELTLGEADGDEVHLTVRETTTMSKADLQTSDLVWGDQKERRLVALVTCDDALGMRPDGHRVANFVALAEVTG